MSLQSHILNPLFYRKEAKQLKNVSICEVREVDVVYELWKVLRAKDVSPNFFVPNALGFYQVSNEIRLDVACHRFGRNFIPDLLQNCSECRMKLRAIENLLRYERILNQKSLAAMLLRPLKVVLKKFQEESGVDAQKQLTKSQDLETISCYLIEYKRKVDKTHNFFRDILQFVVMNATEEIPLQLLENIWKRFLIGLNIAYDLDDEFPLWADLYVELINLLGKYFNVVCDRRQLRIGELDFSSNTSDCQQNSSVFYDTITIDDFQSPSSSRLLPEDHRIKEFRPSYCFNLLMTSSLEADFLQSFRFAEATEAGKQVVVREKSFQEIFNSQEKQMKLKTEFRSLGCPFKSLVELLEKSARSYKEQFMDHIFAEIKAHDRLSIALSEIKEFYSMRAFATTMSYLLDGFNQPVDMTDYLHQLQRDIVAVQNGCCPTRDGTDEENVRNKWRIEMYGGEKLWVLKLTVELEWPLNCVLDDELLELLRGSFEMSQRLFHSYNMIVNLMQKDRLGSVLTSPLVRKKRILGQNLFESVSVIYYVLQAKFEEIISGEGALLIQCKSLTEMEHTIKAWKQKFKKLLDSEGLNRGSYIHAAVDGLCYLIEKFSAFEVGIESDLSLNLTTVSSLSVDCSSFYSQAVNTKKSERNIDNWIKQQSRVIAVLNQAANPSRATDPNSAAYEIAVRSPRSTITRR